MSKNIVFFVHGIGQHAAGWSKAADGPIAALNKAMQLYPACFPAGKTLEDYLDLVEIRYDDIFDKVLDTWKDLGNSIPSNAGFKWVNAISDLMKSVQGDKDLFLRYGGDVLLYCGFELVARAVRLRANSVIATKIYQTTVAANAPGQVAKMSVIAHSLGTTVAQDALYQLANAKWGKDLATASSQLPKLDATPHLNENDQTDYQAAITDAIQNPDKPIPVGLNSLFLIANTTPLLRQTGEYALQKGAGGVYDCPFICNVNHRWDPVSKICGGLSITNPRNGWNNIPIQHVHDKNIHGFAHYLSNPAVHGPIFRRLIDPGFTGTCYGTAQALAKEEKWQGFGGSLADLDKQARQALEDQLNKIATGNSTVKALRAAIEEMAKQMGGM